MKNKVREMLEGREFGRRVKIAFANSHLRRSEVAELTGIRLPTIATWASGRRSGIHGLRADNAVLLSWALGVSLDWLLTGREGGVWKLRKEALEKASAGANAA